MTQRALVRNAASHRQITHAERKAKDQRARELADLKAVLDTEPGRRFLLALMNKCGVGRSVLNDNVITMAAAVGQQDVGHYLRERIAEVDPLMLVTMLREEQLARDRENRELDAVHTTGDEEIPDGDDGN